MIKSVLPHDNRLPHNKSELSPEPFRQLRIAFTVNSSEPGRDGMGDYTLSLAAALRRRGHAVFVVSLNDYWISEAVGSVNEDGVGLLRLPPSLPWAARMARAADALRSFHPEWTSFQMSCYAYHRKGVMFDLNRYLPVLVAACENWQIMFQELWIGFEQAAPWKDRIVGTLQRHSIDRAVRTLRPRLLQTSTPLFQALLKTLGFEASVLPLAGSIAVNPDPGRTWFLEVLGGLGPQLPERCRDQLLIGGFFGSLYRKWAPEPFFSSLRAVARKTGKKVCIFAAGRMRGEVAIWDRLPAAYPDFRFQHLGELAAGRVSQYLQNLDFGIAATPWTVIGKSSATAAMLDHGLPVMVTRNDYQPRRFMNIEPPENPLLILADGGVSGLFLQGLPRTAPHHTSDNLGLRFIRGLEQCSPAQS